MLLVSAGSAAIAAAVLAFVRPGFVTAERPVLVPIAAALGAAVVGVASTAPTGWEPFDLALRVAFGASVPLAAARAGSIATAWLLIVSIATLLIVDAPAPVAAGLAGGVFFVLAAAGIARPETAAIAAAVGIGPLAHADWPLATGASSAAVAVACVPLLVVGLRRAPKVIRRRALWATGSAVLVALAGAAAGGAAALDAKDDIDRAVELATDGIDLLGDDDEAARARLRAAGGQFEAAESTFRSWWARPSLIVPGVAQQVRAVSTMASAGADLAHTAADASEDADLDSVRLRDGHVDLRALATLREPIRRSLASLQHAAGRLEDIRSPLLLTPVADRLRTLRTEIDGATRSAELAAQAVAVAPDLLGANGPRRYFVAVQNPAELTGNGGFMGNWAELLVTDGRFELSRSGRVTELTRGGPDPEGRRIESVPEYTEVWGQHAAQYWGTINYAPDHPTVSRVIAEQYPKSGGQPLDGVISLSPTAVAAFLELTGPIEVEGYPDRLHPDNAARILLHDQYFVFPEQVAAAERRDFLAAVIDVLFSELTHGDLPGPDGLAAALGPAVESRDLQLWSAHPEAQALFERLGATGDVRRDDVDSFGVVTQNFNGNKIDWFLHRKVAYDATWDPSSGAVSGTVTARIENRAPAEGLPPSIIGWGGDVSLGQRPVADGENFMHVSVYATFPIETVTVDGESVAFTTKSELGHHTARFYLSVPSMTTREVVARFEGRVGSSGAYTIRPLRQSTVNPDRISISLSVPQGWELTDAAADVETATGARSISVESDATERTEIAVRSAPSATGILDRLRGTP